VNCPQTHNLLHAFLDGELDLVRHLEIEHHLAECSACADDCEGLRSLRGALELDRLYYRAPPHLAAGFRARLPRPGPSSGSVWRSFLAASAVAAAIALLLGAVVLFQPRRSESVPVADTSLTPEVVASHIRSLQVGHLTDVASTDRHTVLPWFKGKVDFAPAVPDLSEHNFALAGGRLDYLDHRPVAAVVYRRRQHVINLFQWPALSAPDQRLAFETRQGYNLFHWVFGQMNGWAVSDLNPEELREFVYRVNPAVAPAGQPKPCH
jgi:anti-sigma factor RsiW